MMAQVCVPERAGADHHVRAHVYVRSDGLLVLHQARL